MNTRPRQILAQFPRTIAPSDLLPQQREFFHTMEKVAALEGAQGTGKTTVMLSRFIHQCMFPEEWFPDLKPKQIVGLLLMDTFDSLRAKLWDKFMAEVPEGALVGYREGNEPEASLVTASGGVSRIFFRPLNENPKRIEGISALAFGIDEAALIVDEAWPIVLTRANRTSKYAKISMSSTPHGRNWFARVMELAERGEPGFFGRTIKAVECPWIPREVIEFARKHLTPKQFRQAYEASREDFAGQVFPEWDRAVHVIEHFDPPKAWNFYLAVDFGGAAPLAALLIAVEPETNFIYVCGEHYMAGSRIDVHIQLIKEMIRGYEILGAVGDNDDPGAITEFNLAGIPIAEVRKSGPTIDVGIQRIALRLRVVADRERPSWAGKSPVPGSPMLFVSERCHNLIEEFQNLCADDDGGIDFRAKKHALDALRYWVQTYGVALGADVRVARGRQSVELDFSERFWRVNRKAPESEAEGLILSSDYAPDIGGEPFSGMGMILEDGDVF